MRATEKMAQDWASLCGASYGMRQNWLEIVMDNLVFVNPTVTVILGECLTYALLSNQIRSLLQPESKVNGLVTSSFFTNRLSAFNVC